MSLIARRMVLFVSGLLALTLIVAAQAAAAPVWTEVASGTTDDISAIEYQADDRFWFTTTNGKIFRREGSTFVQKLNAPGVVFNDIEMRGATGLAVGNAGAVFRSADGGANWTAVAMPVSNNSSCAANLALGDVQKVAFANDTVAYVFGARNQVMRSANAGATFVNSNRTATNTCKITASDSITGAFFVPGALTTTGYLQSRNFGELFFSANDLEGAQPKSSGINGFETPHRIVGDPANPNRQWGLAVGEDGNSSYFKRTEDAWTSNKTWEEGNPNARLRSAGYDLAFNGGTVLMAGAGGQIMNSIDGRTFFYVDAGGPLVTQEWRAVGLASAAKAAVGGTGGKLALSANVNTTPDIVPPTGTIGGPSAVTVGQPATFTAQLADEAGGSGIDPASLAWTSFGLPNQTGPSATFTFPDSGTQSIKLTFRDRAGNPGEVSRSIVVNRPVTPPPPDDPLPPVRKTVRQSFAGGTIKFSFPGTCVAAGSTFKVRLAFQRSRRKGNVYVKVVYTRFYAQGASVLLDRTAPFAAVIKVRSAQPGTTYRLRARATLKVRHGRPRTRSISASVNVC